MVLAGRAATGRQNLARLELLGHGVVAALAGHGRHRFAVAVGDVERRRVPLSEQRHHVAVAVGAGPHQRRVAVHVARKRVHLVPAEQEETRSHKS